MNILFYFVLYAKIDNTVKILYYIGCHPIILEL